MMSFGNGTKIYLRGAKPSILIYGGLGHRPLSVERLVFTRVCHPLICFIDISLMHSILVFDIFISIFRVHVLTSAIILTQAFLLPRKTLFQSAQESPIFPWLWNQVGLVLPVIWEVLSYLGGYQVVS